MSCELDSAVKPTRVYRVARLPDPWDWPEPSAAEPSRNRWDDPLALYSVLYAASQLEGAYIEVLARFRVDLATAAGLEAVGDGEIGSSPRPGSVPISWAAGRMVGEAVLQGDYCEIGTSRSLAYLRGAMASRLIHYKVDDLDGATIRTGNRELTKEFSRHIYECSTGEEHRMFAGIHYRSRLGDEFENWALFQNTQFEESPVVSVGTRQASIADPEFQRAAKKLGLTVE